MAPSGGEVEWVMNDAESLRDDPPKGFSSHAEVTDETEKLREKSDATDAFTARVCGKFTADYSTLERRANLRGEGCGFFVGLRLARYTAVGGCAS